MPVDTTRVISTRRTQKHISEEELKDIELKRLRGELSCAECRRLKLRCDKKVPCGSCVRRGCESICPCGILSAGQGTRFILADTEQLHRKISEMSHRIRQLEDALAILQATVSEQRHPLLSDDQLKVKFGSEALDPRSSAEVNESLAMKQVIDALGTLALGESGEMKYFGRSAGSEARISTMLLLRNIDVGLDTHDGMFSIPCFRSAARSILEKVEEAVDGGDEYEDGEAPLPLPPEVENLANMLPLLAERRPTPHSIELLHSFLPDQNTASNLCEVYLNHATFFFRPIKREELLHQLLPEVYRSALPRTQSGINTGDVTGQDVDNLTSDLGGPHGLSSLFFVFSLGALLDINLPPYNAIAEHYYHLGRASLSLRPVCGSPSVETVQAVGLMATYHSLAGKKYSRDSAWCIMSLAAKLAQSFGLHRDSARWKLDATTVQKRRNLFWEVFAADVSHSLALGRPPAIHLSYVDCEFPEDEEAALDNQGEIQKGFWALKHSYARHIFYAVAEATLTAKVPSYSTILELDQKVQEMPLPFSLEPPVSPEDGDVLYYSSSLSLRDFYASQHRTVTMIYLHRSFFAQAMLDHPTNPHLSTFAPSFVTAYRSASIIIKASAQQFDRCAALAKRIWFLLYHTFSAAIIVGTIVTRSPNSDVAPSALNDLNMAVKLFEEAAGQSQRARLALTVLKRLQHKAFRIFDPSERSRDTSITSAGESVDNDTDDQLAIFGGQARVLTTKLKHMDAHSESSVSPRSGSEELGTSTTPIPTVFSPHPQTVGGFQSSAAPPDTNTGSQSPPHDSELHPSHPSYLFGFQGTPPAHDRILHPFTTPNVSVADQRSFCSRPPVHTSLREYGPPSNVGQQSQGISGWPGWDHGSVPSSERLSDTLMAQGSDRGPMDWLSTAASLGPNTPGSSVPSNMPVYPLSGMTAGPGGSDTTGQYAQGSEYDIQEKAGLLSPLEPHSQRVKTTGQNGYPQQGSHQFFPPFGPQAMNPGAVELGLSGESRLDSGWVAFMRDCGIFGPGDTTSFS